MRALGAEVNHAADPAVTSEAGGVPGNGWRVFVRRDFSERSGSGARSHLDEQRQTRIWLQPWASSRNPISVTSSNPGRDDPGRIRGSLNRPPGMSLLDNKMSLIDNINHSTASCIAVKIACNMECAI